jgi:hypothetical protein
VSSPDAGRESAELLVEHHLPIPTPDGVLTLRFEITCHDEVILEAIDSMKRVHHVRSSASLSVGSTVVWHLEQREPEVTGEHPLARLVAPAAGHDTAEFRQISGELTGIMPAVIRARG